MSTTSDVTNATVFQRREFQVRSYCRNIDAIRNAAPATIMRDAGRREHSNLLSGASSPNYGHHDPNLRSAFTEYLMRDGTTYGWAIKKQQRTALR